MGTTSSAIFNGNSRYSKDFSAVIDRTVAIASLPISQLNAQKTELTDQTTALSGLDSKFAAIQAAVDRISAAVGGGSFEASVSDPSKLGVSIADGAVEGNYSVEVLDPGAYATSLSSSAWAGYPGPAHTYKLVLAGTQYTVAAADNSAASVATAINRQYGDKVRAIVVNVGSSDTPDYRISLQATKLGNLSPGLLDNGSDVQTQQTTGAQAHYIVNGSGAGVFSSSRTATIATGVSVNLIAASTGPVDVTVTRTTSALSSALDAFAAAYNAAVDEVDKQRGTTSSALAGQSLVSDLSKSLSRMATYNVSGSQVGDLTGIGLELDKTGHLSFNSFKLLASDLVNSAGVTAFLGSAATDGFLKVATDSLSGVERVGTGLLTAAKAAVAQQSTNLDATIATQQARIDALKTQLQERMAAADALIASMEQQYSFFSSMISAQQDASKQYA